MRIIRPLAVLVALMGFTVACDRSSPSTIKSESQTKVETPAGTQTTESTTKQVGSTLESTTETTLKTPEGTVESKLETVVGTVTEYMAGKKIEIMTGDNDKHSYDLEDPDVSYSVDPKVAVGSKVKLEQSTNDAGKKVVAVHLQAV